MSKKLQIVGEFGIPQADWNQSDETAKDYIKNKPDAVFTTEQGLTEDQQMQARANLDLYRTTTEYETAAAYGWYPDFCTEKSIAEVSNALVEIYQTGTYEVQRQSDTLESVPMVGSRSLRWIGNVNLAPISDAPEETMYPDLPFCWYRYIDGISGADPEEGFVATKELRDLAYESRYDAINIVIIRDIDVPIETNHKIPEKYIPDTVARSTPFSGATSDTDGASGLVPRPNAGDEGKFLSGDGTWADIPETIARVDDIAETYATKSDLESIDLSPYETTEDAAAKLDEAKAYTDSKTVDMATTTSVDTSIATHNTSTESHNDIRALITDLSTAVNNFLDVDDTTTDQLSEVLTLIANNKGTLESLTTSKVNVADIINNLTTNSADKVLSAAQGVALKALIDALETELDAKAPTQHNHAISDVTNLQSTLDAKVPTSRTINGKALTANITLSASDVGADASGSADTALATAKSYADGADATTLTAAKSYTDTSIENMVLITVEDIDAICGSSITTEE